MEFAKKNIRTHVVKTVKHVQLTMDRDMNVPDAKPDMEKLIQNKGELRVEEVEILNDRIRVKGGLNYKGLYYTAEAGAIMGSLTGIFDFEEYINGDGIHPADSVKVTAELDDLNVMMIHSRKLSIRALLTLRAVIYETAGVEGAVDVAEECVEKRFTGMHFTKLLFDKRDICRVKGEMPLAVSKPNIHQLLWENIVLKNQEVRLLEGKVQVRGELAVFCLYTGEEQHVPIQHVEWEIPFTGEVDCPECREGMIGCVKVKPGFCQVEVKPDEDGEERILCLEAILELDMKGYEEEKITLLEDIYSTEKEIQPVFETFSYENLIMKNNAKTRVRKRISLKERPGKILQLLHVDGSVKIDEVERKEEGIYVEGVVIADLLLVTDEDRSPLTGVVSMFPFSHLVEVKNLQPEDEYELDAGLLQIHGIMLDGEEMEIKAVIHLDTIAFSKKQGRVMVDAEEKDYDYEKRKEIPGVAVYIAGKEEPLWNVAKAYGSSVEEIRNLNQMEGTDLKAGQKILVVKKVRELL